jgi:hypothetical protein
MILVVDISHAHMIVKNNCFSAGGRESGFFLFRKIRNMCKSELDFAKFRRNFVRTLAKRKGDISGRTTVHTYGSFFYTSELQQT